MNTLSRYLLSSILRSCILVLLALLSLFTFFDLIHELGNLGQGSYTLGTLLSYVLLQIPGYCYEQLPISALIGSMLALSSLNQNSELTVMRAGGLSIWRLLGILSIAGVGFALLTMLCGEWLAPQSERMAKQLRLAARNQLVAQDYRSGFWMRDNGSFVNVREVLPDQTLRQINLYQFDSQRRLQLHGRAERGSWQASEQQWRLYDFSAAHFENGYVRMQKLDSYNWRSALTPSTLSVMMVAPEQMSVSTLYSYIQHLKHNQLNTRRWEIALWGKLIYPLVCLAMLIIALPFSQTSRRSGGVGIKLVIGIMLGLGFYIMNKLFGHMGLLYDWHPIVTAILPPTLFLSLAVLLLWWQERR